MIQKKAVAFYIRLSDADEAVRSGVKEESNSITSQRNLLYSFVRKQEEFSGFEVFEYFDDGYSGTQFDNRKDFQRMIKDAESGKFECIMVKDFSRFGRDYLEVGNYMEFVFPLMGIRFISVNDGYDSSKQGGMTGGMDVAFRNLIYQMYSRDLSRKVKSARRTRNLNGEYTGSYVCYGYKKDANDKHRIVIDEPAAEVVREIFALVIGGHNTYQIARILNDRKVATRLQNQWKNGVNYVPVHNHGDYIWTDESVLQIIRDEQYKGIMIQNKSEVVGFGDNKRIVRTERENWSIVEGAMPRIISDEIFDRANKLITRYENASLPKRSREVNLFQCPYCGRKLVRSSAVNPKLKCSKRDSVRESECSQIYMPMDKAKELALEVVREACRMQIEELEYIKSAQICSPAEVNEKIILEMKMEYERIENSTISFYQLYRDGKYTKEEYIALRKQNQEILEDLKGQIEDLQNEIARTVDKNESEEENFYICSMLDEYDGNILSKIIDKILIYNDRDMQVVLKGNDFFQSVCKEAGKIVSA